jgi:hypothetical protein
MKLYAIGEKNFKMLRRLLLLYQNKKIKINKHNLILILEKKENTIYYILETLIKLIRYYKKEQEEIEEAVEKQENIEKKFIYTESYFKTIMQKLYITQILTVNFKKHKELYKNKELIFLEEFNKLKNYNNNLYFNLLDFYEDEEDDIIKETKSITNIYIYNQLAIEEAIGI